MEVTTLFSKFFSVDEEKQAKIINAGMKQFSQKGFSLASTNEIVKDAGISKGLLFHYFRNKKDLFLFLYDYGVDLIMKEMNEKLDWNQRDFFIKWKEIVLLKIELARKYPELFTFLQAVLNEEAVEVKGELDHKNKALMANAYDRFFKDIDTSKFKDNIDVQKAMNIVIWTMEGFGNQEQEKNKFMPLDQIRLEEIVAEMELYLGVLRQMFYK